MPTRPPRICGCGNRVPADQRCACQQKADRERKARHDQNRPTANARGYGTKWREARVEFLAKHPRCVRCGAPSIVVNHIVPHRGDMKLFWRRSNWEAVCIPCHNGPIQSAEKGGRTQ